MKTFTFTPLLISGALVAFISGCAATAATQTEPAKAPVAMGAENKDKMAKGGCGCCAMHKEGMSHQNKSMGMMEKSTSGQAGMCTTGTDGKGGCGCCDMGKMGKDGCSCSDMGKKDMSPGMHEKHMEMKQEKMPAQPAAN
jgi:hypothetical protein